MTGTPKKHAPKSGGALPPPLGRPLTTSTSSSSEYPHSASSDGGLSSQRLSGSWDRHFQHHTSRSSAAAPPGVEVSGLLSACSFSLFLPFPSHPWLLGAQIFWRGILADGRSRTPQTTKGRDYPVRTSGHGQIQAILPRTRPREEVVLVRGGELATPCANPCFYSSRRIFSLSFSCCLSGLACLFVDHAWKE